MATEQYSIGYEEGFQNGWNAAVDAKPEQPAQQEPVAWMWRCKPYCNWPEWNVSLQRPADSGCDGNKRTEGYEDIPLYNAPQPQRQPQQEPVAWRTFDGEGGYEYRSYEMNEQYAQEWEQRNPKHKGWVEPLYTTPPPCPTCEALARTVMMDQTGRDTSPPAQRKPLTGEEMTEGCRSLGVGAYHTVAAAFEAGVRFAETAHGIKEKST